LLSTVEISSAGTSALEGSRASETAVRVAGKHSIDLSDHRSTFLNRTLVKDVDLIITMGSKHRQTVGVIDPPALAYTYLLTDFCDDEEGDVADPIGMDEDGYEATYAMLEKCIRGLMDKLESFDGWKK